MTAKLCLDNSVFLKLFLKESDSELAKNLFEQVLNKNIQLIEPNFLKIEFFSVLQNKYSRKLINKAIVERSIEIFTKFPIEYQETSIQLMYDCMQTAHKLNQSQIYDCLYLQVAINQNIPFVTADVKFVNYAKKIWKQSYTMNEFLEK